jgi:hypothetical protein
MCGDRFAARFQASLRDAASFMRTRPGVKNAGLLSNGPSGTCVGGGELRFELEGASAATQEVPEGPLIVARQFYWRERATPRSNRVP